MGNFTPFYISNKGGILAALFLSVRRNDPELIDRARLSAYSSPYGRLSRLVYLKMKNEDYDIMTIHGGLQLLSSSYASNFDCSSSNYNGRNARKLCQA